MQIPLAAEPIAHIGDFVVTNSMLNAWIAVVFFVLVAFAVRKKAADVPRGIQNVVEWVIEFILGYIQQVTGDRKRAIRFLPIVGTLFLFILFSNWLALIPGTGSIGIWEFHHGEVVLVPFLRPATGDLNMTLAMAVLAVAASHVLGIVAIGFFKHWNRFIQLGTIFKSIKRGPIAIFTALVEFVIGIIEIIGEVAKMASLSLRLFGNVFAGEVLLTVMAGLMAYAVPIPFMFLEVLIGLIQATVFAMLTAVYLTVLTDEPHEAH